MQLGHKFTTRTVVVIFDKKFAPRLAPNGDVARKSAVFQNDCVAGTTHFEVTGPAEMLEYKDEVVEMYPVSYNEVLDNRMGNGYIRTTDVPAAA